MKKFFSRFSTTGPPSPSSKRPAAADEKLSSLTSTPTAGEKVRALAARYEGLTVVSSGGAQIQDSPRKRAESVENGGQARRPELGVDPSLNLGIPANWLTSGSEADQQPSPPAGQAQALSPSQRPRTSSANDNALSVPHPDAGMLAQSESSHHKAQDAREASGGSTGSAGSAGGTKQVAFAPSPKKTHTLDRRRDREANGQQDSLSPEDAARMGNDDDNKAEDAPSVRSEASHVAPGCYPAITRHTIASAARAKNPLKSSGAPEASLAANRQTNGGVTGSEANMGSAGRSANGQSEQSSSSRKRGTMLLSENQARLMRSKSGSGTAGGTRHQGSGGSGSIHGDVSHSPMAGSISSPLPISAAAASSVTLPHDGGDTLVHPPNSIPFGHAQGQGPVRSSSPLSFATGTTAAGRRGSAAARFSSAGSEAGVPSQGARSLGGPSWSEMTEEDLVLNLGPRERTRQEVLWEIVASEERYVAELEKTKELYIDTLLHPLRFAPPSSPQSTYTSAPLPPDTSSVRRPSADEGGDLPIAARFMSRESIAGQNSHQDAAAQAQSRSSEAAGARSPYSAGAGLGPKRSHRRFSMASNQASSSYTALTSSNHVGGARGSLAQGLGIGLGRTFSHAGTTSAASPASVSGAPSASSSAIRKWQKRRSGDTVSVAGSQSNASASAPVALPASLKAVLEVLSDGLVEGHALLSEALKARYEEQWPLVRSLADVFLAHAYILRHYAEYVCHMERALDQLEEAVELEKAMRGKKVKKDEQLKNTIYLGRMVAALEAQAYERGESGLSIFLSKPFQRLLKYPLLFQNLLFHTDPSTFEFESTVAMVVEVERIVRSIEDEKVSTEERDKARDAFARIEGLTDKGVLKPSSNRLLVEEIALYDENSRRAISESSPTKGNTNRDATNGSNAASPLGTPRGTGSGSKATAPNLRSAIKSKRSYRRLSDFLASEEKSNSTKAPSMGSKRDLWLVRFSDVELRCQRVGVTALPLASSAALSPNVDGDAVAGTGEKREAGEPPDRDFASRSKDSKERLKALRKSTLKAKTRNLYKFIAVASWTSEEGSKGVDAGQEKPTETADGLASPIEDDEEDAEESDVEDGGEFERERHERQSKLSFSYWGNDKVEPRRPSSSGAGNSAATPLSSPAAFRQANAAAAAAAAAAAQPSMASTRSASPSRRNTAAFTDSTNSVVSNSHAKPRVEKFGGRLRTAESLNAPSSPTTASQRRAPSRTATMGSTTEFGTTIKPVRSGTGGSRTQVQTQAQRSPLPDATPAADGSGTLGTSSPIGSALQPAERAPWRP